MQSWGTRSRFIHRDTESEPTKSGVLGLVAAALGKPRGEDLSDLAAMSMAVRIDAPGHPEVDYQTTLNVIRADGSKNDMAVQSWRHYLADARFTVALGGELWLCEVIAAALRAPVWPLFLGRKGYVPGEPVWLPDGVREGTSVLEALREVAWPERDGAPLPNLEAVVECAEAELGDERNDVPLSFAVDDRRYRSRRVRRVWLEPAVRGKEVAS
jgi:CRISPR system Cascade subunit CasD